MDYQYLLSATVAAVIIGLLYNLASTKKGLALPPGPKGLPVIGNTLQIPPDHPWKAYDKWSKQYGGLFTLSIAGKMFIVVGSVKAAQDLLNKRSIKSSSRPPMIMANDLVTKGMHILLRPYDNDYRLHQRMQAPVLSVRAAGTYAKIYELESTQFLHEMLQDGTEPDFVRHMYRCNLGVVYALVYGIKIETGEEQCLKDSRVTQASFGRVTTPGAYLVDTFPFLNALPAALAPWKREAEALYKVEAALHLRNLENGLNAKGWTFAKQFVESAEAKQLSKVEVAYSLGILTNAGFDTTTMQLEWFIVACLTYPQTVAKGQAALDQVVGRDRLPELTDKDKLPYICAMIDEVTRWRSIMNGGFPHHTTEEDEYNGYRIPSDCILLPCCWSIDHDEAVYKDPAEYVPERWLSDENGLNSPAAAFGFGRRVCTGRNIARNNMWMVAARLPWAFDIKYARNAQGQEIKVDPTATTGGSFNTKPIPFKARFEPRGEWVTRVVEREWQDAGKSIANCLNGIEKIRVWLDRSIGVSLGRAAPSYMDLNDE